jgi:hypothetical protein
MGKLSVKNYEAIERGYDFFCVIIFYLYFIFLSLSISKII